MGVNIVGVIDVLNIGINGGLHVCMYMCIWNYIAKQNKKPKFTY